jgi:hypothetical protein
MIDEDGNRKASPEAPAIAPHMHDGLRSAAQRKVFGDVAGEPTPKPAAKKSARKATKRASKK